MNLFSHRGFSCLIALLAGGNLIIVSGQQGLVAEKPADLMRVGDKVIKVNEAISLVQGFGKRLLA